MYSKYSRALTFQNSCARGAHTTPAGLLAVIAGNENEGFEDDNGVRARFNCHGGMTVDTAGHIVVAATHCAACQRRRRAADFRVQRSALKQLKKLKAEAARTDAALRSVSPSGRGIFHARRKDKAVVPHTRARIGEGSGNGQVVGRWEQREVFGLLLVPGAGMLLPRTPRFILSLRYCVMQ